MQGTNQREKSKADVKLNYNSKGEWWMAKDMGNAKPPGDYPKLKVGYDHDGEFVFKILNPKDVTFATDKPFAAKASANNPPDFDAQFDVSPGGTDTLVVKVKNSNTSAPGEEYPGGDYTYELHFSNATTLDPIITNGGCCRTTMQDNMVFYALGAVAIVALIVLIARPLLRRR